jgi:uncharacterized protein (DUF305 family)
MLTIAPLAYHLGAYQAEAADTGNTEADQALKASMVQMHKGMMIDYTGDADTDFVKSMLPHHQGAVDMAKIELQYGKDPAMRKLAEDIVAAQQQEIALMNDWLKAHGK